jgi:quinol monooxygenase YgiN
MYLSRLTFHTQPGKTHEVEQELSKLVAMVREVGGLRPRVLHNHFASLGAPDVVLEQEALDLETLERQISQVTKNPAFQQWTGHISELLAQSPKREVYLILD